MSMYGLFPRARDTRYFLMRVERHIARDYATHAAEVSRLSVSLGKKGGIWTWLPLSIHAALVYREVKKLSRERVWMAGTHRAWGQIRTLLETGKVVEPGKKEAVS